MLRKLPLLLTLSAMLAGCVLPGTVAPPTPYPESYIPTVIFLTAQSINATISASITPSATPTVTPTPLPATPQPTITPSPAPGLPLAAIQINSPGPMSRIVSSVDVHATVLVHDGDKLETTLYDETGQVISRPTLRIFSETGEYPVSVKIPFEIRAAGETGIVQISIKDSHNRLLFVVSEHVLLLSDGVNQINPPGNTIYERAIFYQLPPEAEVSGGTLAVSGRYEPMNSKPVILELIADDGTSLGLRVLNMLPKGSQSFDTTIPYKVTEATPARLFIYQDDDIIDGRAYLYSQPLTLNP